VVIEDLRVDYKFRSFVPSV